MADKDKSVLKSSPIGLQNLPAVLMHSLELHLLFWSGQFPDLFSIILKPGSLSSTQEQLLSLLMVFLIQKSQNKDSKAIQIKLNELIAANEKASNRIVDIEDLTEKELDQLHCYYEKLADFAKEDADIHTSHSIDAAQRNQDYKHEFFKRKHDEWLEKQQKK